MVLLKKFKLSDVDVRIFGVDHGDSDIKKMTKIIKMMSSGRDVLFIESCEIRKSFDDSFKTCYLEASKNNIPLVYIDSSALKLKKKYLFEIRIIDLIKSTFLLLFKQKNRHNIKKYDPSFFDIFFILREKKMINLITDYLKKHDFHGKRLNIILGQNHLVAIKRDLKNLLHNLL
jgi:hypothetical protein